MYRFLHVSDSNLLTYMQFYFAKKIGQGGGAAQWQGRRISDQGRPGSNPGRCTFRCGIEQVTFTLLSTGLTREAVDGRPAWTDFDEAGDYVVPNVLSPRDLVFRPDNMDETVPHKYRSVAWYASAIGSPEIDPRVLHILSSKRFALSCRFEKSKFSVNGTEICTKYWLTASVMLAQCS